MTLGYRAKDINLPLDREIGVDGPLALELGLKFISIKLLHAPFLGL